MAHYKCIHSEKCVTQFKQTNKNISDVIVSIYPHVRNFFNTNSENAVALTIRNEILVNLMHHPRAYFVDVTRRVYAVL